MSAKPSALWARDPYGLAPNPDTPDRPMRPFDAFTHVLLPRATRQYAALQRLPIIVAGPTGCYASTAWLGFVHAKTPATAARESAARNVFVPFGRLDSYPFNEAWKQAKVCLVPASGWVTYDDVSGATRTIIAGGGAVTFAGLLSTYYTAHGKSAETVGIITYSAPGKYAGYSSGLPAVVAPDRRESFAQYAQTRITSSNLSKSERDHMEGALRSPGRDVSLSVVAMS